MIRKKVIITSNRHHSSNGHSSSHIKMLPSIRSIMIFIFAAMAACGPESFVAAAVKTKAKIGKIGEVDKSSELLLGRRQGIGAHAGAKPEEQGWEGTRDENIGADGPSKAVLDEVFAVINEDSVEGQEDDGRKGTSAENMMASNKAFHNDKMKKKKKNVKKYVVLADETKVKEDGGWKDEHEVREIAGIDQSVKSDEKLRQGRDGPNQTPKPTSKEAESENGIATKVFTLDEGMSRLKKLDRGSLRGSKDADTAAVISEIKDILGLHLGGLQSLQKHLNDGNVEEAVLSLKSMVGDVDDGSLVGAGNEVKNFERLSSSVDGISLSMNDIPNDQLIQFIQPKVLDDVVEHTQHLSDILQEIDLSIFSIPPNNDHSKTEQFHREHDTFKFDSDPSSFEFAAGEQSVSNGNFNPNNFSVQNLLRHHKANMGNGFSMPKLSKFTNFHDDNIIMAKHQNRLDALGDTCAPRCDLEDWSCNCERLFECVGNMTDYDLAVLVAGGYIDTNPSSNTYGNFTIPVQQLNLYDADQGVNAKLASIQRDVSANSNPTKAICNHVLQQLFSACHPSDTTCTNPNLQSFAISTEQVCEAVNTPKKLLFEAIGDEFDDFVDKFTPSPCEPLSYDTCAQFVVEFDKLYQGRNTANYPLGNPMLRDTSSTVHDQVDNKAVFDRVQFPIQYNFFQDHQTGVVTREFGTSFDATAEQIQYFFLSNPSSGKVLGLEGSSCDDLTPMEVQDRVYGGDSDHQQFSLTDDGRLKSKKCSNSNKVLTNKLNENGDSSCRDGNLLVIEGSSGLPEGDFQRWTFNRDGSIVNKECGQWKGNLAISTIEDDSITKIDYTDTIPVQFLNPESNLEFALECVGYYSRETGMNSWVKHLKAENIFESQYDHTFNLIRTSSGKWKILSKGRCNQMQQVLALLTLDCTSEYQSLAIIDDPNPGNQACNTTDCLLSEWNIRDGKIESNHCEGMVMGIIQNRWIGSYIGLVPAVDGGWNQRWSIKSNSARLLTDNDNPGQEWKAVFALPNYNYALQYGFPGDVDPDDPDSCLDSMNDKRIAQSAMHSCDESMSLLVGETTSVGTLRAISSLVNDQDKGPTYMPGECCMDVATNSEFFGYRYDPTLEDSTNTKMSCQNRGPWHLGISAEACKNAGGEWYRTPCVTLRECIDDRPPRFELDAPLGGSCQNTLEQLNTAFVSTSMLHANFTFGATDTGCFKFCQSLPDYSLQIGMEVLANTSTRFVKVSLPGSDTVLSLVEVQVFAVIDGVKVNVALASRGATATHSSNYQDNTIQRADRAIDGSLSTHTATDHDSNPWWQVELQRPFIVDSIVVYHRSSWLGHLSGATVSLLNTNGGVVKEFIIDDSPGVEYGDTEYFSFRDIPSPTCTCLYADGQVPSRELLPAYATPSVPKFSLKDTTGMFALGLRFKSDCTADEIGVEFQLYNGSPRQEFKLTYDSMMVSVLCPERVLTVDGDHLVAMAPRFKEVDDSLHEQQQWNFNDDESITNVASPTMHLSAIKDDSTLVSFYFALENLKSHLAMGALGEKDDCRDGMKIELQESDVSLNQQFFVHGSTTPMTEEGNGSALYSAMCPQLSISVPNNDCESAEELHLSSEGGTWKFTNSGTIESVECPGMFIDIDNGSLNTGNAPTAPVDLLSVFKFRTRISEYPDGTVRNGNATTLSSTLKWQPVPEDNVPGFEHSENPDETGYEGVSRANFTETQIPTWDESVALGVGAAIALSNHSSQNYQQWNMQYKSFRSLMGPFSFVNPTNGLAFGVGEGQCADNMMLEVQNNDYSSLNQKFYLGNRGSIFSSKCPGLVISMGTSEDCNSALGQSLKLQVFVSNEIQMKWKVNNEGSIESAKCLGMVIGTDESSGTDAILQQHDADNSNQLWRRQNVQFLDGTGNTRADDWIQIWTISSTEPSYNITDYQELRGRHGNGATELVCYPPNPAFNRAFEDFASNIVINNAADEDQCRTAREEMGFDSNHEFDTEVCQQFHHHMCDGFFDGIDHLTASLTEPPTFEQVEYEEVEYEEVEYEEVEYEGVGYETVAFDFEGYEVDSPLPSGALNDYPRDKDITVNTSSQEYLKALGATVLNLKNLLKAAETLFTHTKDLSICDTLPEVFCVPTVFGEGGCVNNLWKTSCEGSLKMALGVMQLTVLKLTTNHELAERQFTQATLGPDLTVYGYEYSKATYNNLQAHNTWNIDALKQINRNMQNQHTNMRKDLQDRHTAMEVHIRENINESRNALGQSIIDSQNSLGAALVESQNANGELIVESQNALGHYIVDAQNANGQLIMESWNAMSDQHHNMLEWLEINLCLIYKEQGGICEERLIGPLEEDQTRMPLQLQWPEGQTTLMEKMEKVQIMEGERVQGDIQDKVDAIEGKVDAIEGNMKVVEGKVDAIEDMVMQLIEQNKKMMQLMESKNMEEVVE